MIRVHEGISEVENRAFIALQESDIDCRKNADAGLIFRQHSGIYI
jgi:hypothetical protein